MKFIHCADIHLDSKMETNLKFVQARERKEELLDTFNRMVQYAINNEIKVIVIAGDLFDTKTVIDRTMKYFLNVVKRNPTIDFLYLSGNHEEDALEKFKDIYPKNLYTFTNKWTTYRYDDITFTGVKIEDDNIYNELNLNKNDKNIVILHGDITKNSPDDKIDLSLLINKNIDYLALGHIHKSKIEKLDKRGILAYSGCLEGRGMDECGEKGFLVVETDDFSYEFKKNAKRTFYEVEVDISDLEQYDIELKITSVLHTISKVNGIKLILKGTYNVDTVINEEKIEKDLNDVYFFARVYNQTTLKINKEDYEYDISLKGEFVREVLKSDLDEELKEAIIQTGIKALRGDL